MRLILKSCVTFASLSLIGQNPPVSTTRNDRNQVRLTLYQNGRAFIQESRTVTVPKGVVLLQIEDLSSSLDSSTMQLQNPDLSTSTGVMRQSFLFTRPTSQQLLARFEGKRVKVASTKEGVETIEHATLLSYEGESAVLQYPDRIEVLGAWSGKRLILPGLPPEIPASPRMEVALTVPGAGKKAFSIAYISSDFQWTPTYSVIINPSEKWIDLTAWAAILNGTKTQFDQAQVDLLAGDVPMQPDARSRYGGMQYDKAPPPPPPPPLAMMRFSEGLMPGSMNAGERRVYPIPGKLDLLPQQSVQVPFLEVHGIKVRKEYRLTRNLFLDGEESQGSESQQIPVEASLLFMNEAAQHLGRQLPSGAVRLYEGDDSGVLRFLGEDQMAETSAGSEVRLGLGSVTDLTANCRMTDHKVNEPESTKRSVEERAFEIVLSNQKDQANKVHVQVDIQGQWTLLSSSLPGVKEQAHTLGFQVQVPAKGKVILQYRVKTTSAR